MPRRKNRARPGPCFMTRSQIFSLSFRLNSANDTGFCIVLQIAGGGVCDFEFNHDFEQHKRKR